MPFFPLCSSCVLFFEQAIWLLVWDLQLEVEPFFSSLKRAHILWTAHYGNAAFLPWGTRAFIISNLPKLRIFKGRWQGVLLWVLIQCAALMELKDVVINKKSLFILYVWRTEQKLLCFSIIILEWDVLSKSTRTRHFPQPRIYQLIRAEV